MPYLIRSSSGDCTIALTFAGALRTLRQVGPDAAIYTFTGMWLAGRRVAA